MQLTFDEMERKAYMAGRDTSGYMWQLAEYGFKMEETAQNITSCEPEAGFPEEDCLEDIIKFLSEQIEDMHGNNKLKAPMKELLEMIVDKQTELANNAAYGLEELNKIREMF